MRSSPETHLSRTKKILLIQPPEASHSAQFVLPTRYPISLFTIAAGLMQRFANLEITIADLSLPKLNLAKTLFSFKPDLIGLTFMTPQNQMADGIITTIRSALGHRVPIVGGGVHASAVPLETMQTMDFDYLLIHETEETFPALVAALDTQSTVDKISGLYYHEGNEIRHTKPGQRITNLDNYPSPTEVLPQGYLEQYARIKYINQEGLVVPIFTSRGCRYVCAYCASNVVFPKQSHLAQPILRSSHNVNQEIRDLFWIHGARTIRVEDDYFDIDPKRVSIIATTLKGLRGIARATIDSDLEICFRALPRKVTNGSDATEYYRHLHQAGVTRIELGVESGDLKLMHRMAKTIDRDEKGLAYAQENTRAIQAAGILVKYYLMVGLPGQDWHSINLTQKLLATHQPDRIGVSIAMPYPGTRLAKMPGIWIEPGYEHMLHEPPEILKGLHYIPFTHTDVMSSREIGRARTCLLNYFEILGGTILGR